MMEEYQFQNYVVAFVDILGQREQLRKLKSFPENKEEIQWSIQIMQRTAGRSLKVREGLETFFKEFENRREEDGFYEKLPEDKRHLFEHNPQVHVYGLSDAVVLAVPLGKPKNEHIPLMGTLRVLGAVSAVMVTSLLAEHPLRGGIEMAPGIMVEKEFFGPALAMAYDLESHFAEYPRVIFGPRLLGYLRHVSQGIDSEIEDVRFAAGFAKQCLAMGVQDTDGRTALDFFQVPDGGLEVRQYVSDKALGFVREQCQRFLDSGDEKLRGRYHRLLVYLENRIAQWPLDSEDS